MTSDVIANMITSIRNANLRKIKVIELPATKITKSIGKILLQEGFIDNLREREENNKNFLILTLRSQRRKHKASITTIRRISKPGLRIYSNHQEIPKVLGGIGIVILSTSQGIMSDRQARQNRIGGEILCYIW
uniref:Small ribosomal subunit protein uS8c n=1 Tax=Chaetosphaeridium globosum TaxID=96477 RepID=RR8_CHAGL|nr:ribosomal protein S8 [Chaetosphaeridium globosum]P59032.1 RecName: Full=Small ribosomal subunit protein uS8c; AltName: Full=30S ribosomal protein S8, chloroplastic [Chaetosphaeridium globosum]AAM96579.1 ribosomal protein S8 [Chaetosphaeridium globosum]